MNNTQEKLFELIAKSLQISIGQVNEELAIGSIPEWDSLAHLRLIHEIETMFEIQIDMDRLMDVEDVGDLLDIVENIRMK